MKKLFVFVFILVQSACASLPNDKKSEVAASHDCVSYKSTAQVSGVSMEPLIPNASIATILMGFYDCHPVVRGDIISFRFVVRKEAMIKRVVAIPNDIVEVHNGKLFVNGSEVLNSVSTPYFFSKEEQKWFLYNVEQGKLAQDRFLVLSDRTENLYDSRKFGSVFRSQIEGKLLLETVRK